MSPCNLDGPNRNRLTRKKKSTAENSMDAQSHGASLWWIRGLQSSVTETPRALRMQHWQIDQAHLPFVAFKTTFSSWQNHITAATSDSLEGMSSRSVECSADFSQFSGFGVTCKGLGARYLGTQDIQVRRPPSFEATMPFLSYTFRFSFAACVSKDIHAYVVNCLQCEAAMFELYGHHASDKCP
eukprot:Gb_40908 [translate_table: standard]